MDNANTSAAPRRRWPIIAGFAFAGALVAILVGASAWQSGIHKSDQDKAETHASTAALLQDAGGEAQAAAELLRQYVAEGDATLIPQIQSHSTTAVETLTQAVSQGGSAEMDQIAVAGAGLAKDAGGVVALRLSGDAAGAAAALDQMAPVFDESTTALEDAIALELGEAASLQDSAKTADDFATWLLIAAIAVGAATGLAGAVVFVTAVAKRRVPDTPSPA